MKAYSVEVGTLFSFLLIHLMLFVLQRREIVAEFRRLKNSVRSLVVGIKSLVPNRMDRVIQIAEARYEEKKAKEMEMGIRSLVVEEDIQYEVAYKELVWTEDVVSSMGSRIMECREGLKVVRHTIVDLGKEVFQYVIEDEDGKSMEFGNTVYFKIKGIWENDDEHPDDDDVSGGASSKRQKESKFSVMIVSAWFGQQVSVEKSNIYFSPCTNYQAKRKIKEIMGFKEMGPGAVYLGNSLIFSRRRAQEFNKVTEKVQHRMESWQSRLLSRAGKRLLIRSWLEPSPSTQCRLLNGLDHLVRDSWIPWLSNSVPKTKDNIKTSRWKLVADLHSVSYLEWDQQLIARDQEIADAIMKVKWSSSLNRDKLFWMGNNSGRFSVKSCYKIITKDRIGEVFNPIWAHIWKANLHERLKLHCWRMLANTLPTRDVVVTRTWKGDNTCQFCGAEVESSLHIFKKCQLRRILAFGSRWGCRIDF
ncbi:hypothetical protein FNV43_RR05950 [Rhamnella rubrinervis]|uniref:Reverse transcriptase zinc-binding domain-containing protein n=1 Tax=Rhamnella rubrinervis TaxID=2594499 RepID=A0A8K0MKV6_9ROSA|nr:hypothetical protein FNV43_RR05950 [Rhamnella rubrinervis]